MAAAEQLRLELHDHLFGELCRVQNHVADRSGSLVPLAATTSESRLSAALDLLDLNHTADL